MTTAIPDPRPVFAVATEWVTDLLKNTTELGAPTPCAEFDTRALAGHLVGVADRAVALAEIGTIEGVSAFPDFEGADGFAERVARARSAWADDALLGRPVTVPWGQVPGAGALWGYTNEMLVHGWDLAVATRQPAEADPDAAEAMLAIAPTFLRAEIRDDPGVPFGPVVTPREGAGPTERLANWSGRSSTGWV
ncbi:TIGR03086 family metal-binding protein [Tsukamurella sp. 8F]|uniref:TIGR03086 family metal-binding protein n=1 Tax=unclassified Tsukamurella TaxID=2633480 RepID=UPI0023B90CA6|nr:MULTISPECIES: TIGR03086 family metal-binding protein [unclassified Tsukamurella]MDF0531993.1 TIGR03086 family metal-binding protein [Tsukamurella sp. 8J]MDF0588892.1 TIGR03086 family metal-binding protein [Tsukamurella sp. 8F]